MQDLGFGEGPDYKGPRKTATTETTVPLRIADRRGEPECAAGGPWLPGRQTWRPGETEVPGRPRSRGQRTTGQTPANRNANTPTLKSQ